MSLYSVQITNRMTCKILIYLPFISTRTEMKSAKLTLANNINPFMQASHQSLSPTTPCTRSKAMSECHPSIRTLDLDIGPQLNRLQSEPAKWRHSINPIKVDNDAVLLHYSAGHRLCSSSSSSEAVDTSLIKLIMPYGEKSSF